MYVSMYVCMYVCMYEGMYVHIYMYMYIYICETAWVQKALLNTSCLVLRRPSLPADSNAVPFWVHRGSNEVPFWL